MLKRVLIGANPRRTVIRALAIAVALFALSRFVFLPIRTEGISMLPTCPPGALKLVNLLAFTFDTPERGDIVAIRLAGNSVLYVKRVIGLPGERLRIDRGIVLVNDRPLSEPYVTKRAAWVLKETVLGSDEYFVAGDNRSMRIEDHSLGKAARSRIVGKLLL